MSEAKMTGRKVNKPGCATVHNQATALFSLPMRLGQHVALFLRGDFPVCFAPICQCCGQVAKLQCSEDLTVVVF